MIGKLPDGNSALEEYKPFAAVDFIVTDLDGTLTVGSTPVLEQIKNKIAYLKRMGVSTTVATGRSYVGAQKLINDLHIVDGMPIVLYNGCVLVEHNKDNLIAICTIPFYAVEHIWEIIKKTGAGIYIYTYDISIHNFQDLSKRNHIEEIVYYSGYKCVQEDINGTRVKYLAMDEICNQNIVSILLPRDELTQMVYKQLMDFFESDVNVVFTDSGSGFIEVKSAMQNKSIIISELKKIERVTKYKAYKILAIGDNDNDADLLENADISVAVANSSPTAIRHADYICKNKSACGFLDMLTVIERAKRYFKT